MAAPRTPCYLPGKGIMNSPGYNTPYGPRPYDRHPHPQYPPKPRPVEDTLLQREISIEKKMFVIALKENPRGRFLRITESGGTGRWSTVIVPATGMKDFQKLLAEMVQAHAEIPDPNSLPGQYKSLFQKEAVN
jgi:hypothetical protein